MKYKIVLINFFYGEFPWYFKFFLKSAGYNPAIDFLLFSDNSVDCYDIPGNVTFYPSTLENFNILAREKIGININIKRPYKVCDFKPCFGLIFQDLIRSYDFWGFYDIDLVLGDIRNFITDEVLDENDVISVRHDYPSGFFMLFRNNELVNNLFRKSKDYKTILLSEDNHCFDECNYKYEFVQSPEDILTIDCETESMLEVIVKAHREGLIGVFFDFFVIEGTPGKIKFDNGSLTYGNKYEILLYHFVSMKDNIFSRFPEWAEIPEIFYIDKYSFRKKNNLFARIKGFWINNFYPRLFIDFLQFNRFLSGIFFRRKVNKLKPGPYFLGETVFNVVETNKTSTLSDYQGNFNIYQLMFMPSYFYIDKSPYCYRLIGQNNAFAENFIEIRSDGNTAKYQLRIPTENS